MFVHEAKEESIHPVFDIDWHLSSFSLASYPLDQTKALLKNEVIHRNLLTLLICLTLISTSQPSSSQSSLSLMFSRTPPFLKVCLPFNKLLLQIHC